MKWFEEAAESFTNLQDLSHIILSMLNPEIIVQSPTVPLDLIDTISMTEHLWKLFTINNHRRMNQAFIMHHLSKMDYSDPMTICIQCGFVTMCIITDDIFDHLREEAKKYVTDIALSSNIQVSTFKLLKYWYTILDGMYDIFKRPLSDDDFSFIMSKKPNMSTVDTILQHQTLTSKRRKGLEKYRETLLQRPYMGGVFQAIQNDERLDRMLMASSSLVNRLRELSHS
jgi:hypothetical protein